MDIAQLNDDVSQSDLDAVLAFIPRLKDLNPESLVIEAPGRILKESEQEVVLALHGQYHPMVGEFQQALYVHKFIRDYDWGKWVPRAKAIYKNSKLLEHASMLTCIKLLTPHTRNDRFVDGHFACMLGSGHLLAILERMQEIKDGTVTKQGPSRTIKKGPYKAPRSSH